MVSFPTRQTSCEGSCLAIMHFSHQASFQHQAAPKQESPERGASCYEGPCALAIRLETMLMLTHLLSFILARGPSVSVVASELVAATPGPGVGISATLECPSSLLGPLRQEPCLSCQSSRHLGLWIEHVAWC